MIELITKEFQSWKEELNPVQIQQVASYIKSLNGTLNGGGKDPQGELSVKEITPAPVQNDSTTTVTSVE